MVGSSLCTIISASNTEILCNLGASRAGPNSVIVHRAGHGHSNKNLSYRYELSVSDISHTEG